MTFKILGVILVIASCGSVGFRIAANHRAEEKALRNLIAILDFMECELRFRLTPLPTLFQRVGSEFTCIPGSFFTALATDMDKQISPDLEVCIANALRTQKALPEITRKAIEIFGKTAGRFDLEGQIKGLHAARNECKRNLEILGANRETRLRSYQTLGLCAGASLAILLI